MTSSLPISRFGLLHRIPAQPTDREPGTMPPELTEPSDEFEEQELFVPADIDQHSGSESPEESRGEYFARHSPRDHHQSSETETEHIAHGRDAEVHTPTPGSHGRPYGIPSPTPTRAVSGSFMNGDSATQS